MGNDDIQGRKKNNAKCVKNVVGRNIFFITNLFVMYLASGDLVTEAYKAYHIMILLIIISLVAILVKTDWTESKMMCSIMILCYVLLFMNSVIRLQLNDKIYGCVSYIIGIAIVIITEYKKKQWDADRIILCLISLVSMWKGLGMFGILFDRLVVFVLALPFFLFGIHKKNPIFKYAGGILIFSYFEGYVPIYEKAMFSMIVLIIMHLVVYKKDDRDINWLWLHILSLIYTDKVLYGVFWELFRNDFISDVLVYFVITLFNIIMLRSANKRKKELLAYYIINFLAILRGLIFMVFMPKNIIVLVAFTFAFFVNSKKLWNSDKLISKIYLAGKWIVYALFTIIFYALV